MVRHRHQEMMVVRKKEAMKEVLLKAFIGYILLENELSSQLG
jgi:hypothetical protein